MSDVYHTIGEAAGKIYKVLDENGAKTAASLQKQAGVADSDVFQQAIGWLAREGKLDFQKKGKSAQIALSEKKSCCS